MGPEEKPQVQAARAEGQTCEEAARTVHPTQGPRGAPGPRQVPDRHDGHAGQVALPQRGAGLGRGARGARGALRGGAAQQEGRRDVQGHGQHEDESRRRCAQQGKRRRHPQTQNGEPQQDASPTL